MGFTGDNGYTCPQCGHHESDIGRLPSVGGIRACGQCGLTEDEGSYAIQDELSSMFDKNMSLDNPPPPTAVLDSAGQQQQPWVSALGYSTSQHYHHSHHVAPTLVRRESQGVLGNMPTASISLLMRRNINPQHLQGAQLKLFEDALPEQRERLLELWSIAPPDKGRVDERVSARGITSMDIEEELARQRYERASGQQQPQPQQPQGSAEPYMLEGYQAHTAGGGGDHLLLPPDPSAAYRQATDPAFSSKEWWRDFVQQQPMEFQYGMFQQFHAAEGQARKEDEDMG